MDQTHPQLHPSLVTFHASAKHQPSTSLRYSLCPDFAATLGILPLPLLTSKSVSWNHQVQSFQAVVVAFALVCSPSMPSLQMYKACPRSPCVLLYLGWSLKQVIHVVSAQFAAWARDLPWCLVLDQAWHNMIARLCGIHTCHYAHPAARLRSNPVDMPRTTALRGVRSLMGVRSVRRLQPRLPPVMSRRTTSLGSCGACMSIP